MNNCGSRKLPKSQQSIFKYVLYTVGGFALLATGGILGKNLREANGIMQTLPYILIGIGSGIFGQNIGTIFQIRSLRRDPDAAKQLEIEEHDERNMMIRNNAKAKAYDLMVYVFGALILAFALMSVDIWVVLAFVASYLFVIFSNVYYISKYGKEM